MPLSRLLAAEVSDPDRRWSIVNTRAGATVLVVLVLVAVLRSFGVSWALWVGFAAGAVAVIGAGVNLWRGVGGPSGSRSDSQAEAKRVSRLLRRGRPIPEEDAELADRVARLGLRTFGINLWTCPLIAASQLAALPVRGGDDVVRLVLLVLALGLSVVALVAGVRFRRGLLDPAASRDPR